MSTSTPEPAPFEATPSDPALAVRADWQGGTGAPAIFVHANGLPPRAYRPFLEALSPRLSVTALATRALTQPTPPEPSLRWSDLGTDLVTWLAAKDAPPTLAIGHSMGATSLMYAVAQNPERFTGLVLIEPAMLAPLQARIYSLLPLGVRRRMNPAKATLAKRDRWASAEAFRESCGRSGLYREVSPDGLDALVEAAVHPVDGGVTLTFPKSWEAHFYLTAPYPVPALKRVRLPVIGIRAAPSIFLDDQRWKLCTASQPKGWYGAIVAGHLVPLEKPEATALKVFEGLSAQGLL